MKTEAVSLININNDSHKQLLLILLAPPRIIIMLSNSSLEQVSKLKRPGSHQQRQGHFQLQMQSPSNLISVFPQTLSSNPSNKSLKWVCSPCCRAQFSSCRSRRPLTCAVWVQFRRTDREAIQISRVLEYSQTELLNYKLWIIYTRNWNVMEMASTGGKMAITTVELTWLLGRYKTLVKAWANKMMLRIAFPWSGRTRIKLSSKRLPDLPRLKCWSRICWRNKS